jgi:hypothetical protein
MQRNKNKRAESNTYREIIMKGPNVTHTITYLED